MGTGQWWGGREAAGDWRDAGDTGKAWRGLRPRALLVKKVTQHQDYFCWDVSKSPAVVELCPQKRYTESLTPVPVPMTFFGNRVLADVTELK